MIRLTFSAFTGCSPPAVVADDRQEARQYAARLIRRRRKAGFVCLVLVPGRHWEVSEPESAGMQSDLSGLLSLEPIWFNCPECDSQWRVHSDAWACCSVEVSP